MTENSLFKSVFPFVGSFLTVDQLSVCAELYKNAVQNQEVHLECQDRGRHLEKAKKLKSCGAIVVSMRFVQNPGPDGKMTGSGSLHNSLALRWFSNTLQKIEVRVQNRWGWTLSDASFQAIWMCPNLQELILHHVNGAFDLNGAKRLKKLRVCDVHDVGPRVVSCLKPVTHLTNLQELSLDGRDGPGFSDLSPLKSLYNLKMLDLCGCDHLEDLSPLAHACSLEHLELAHCDELQDVSPLVNCRNLSVLAFIGCPVLTNICCVADISALDLLHLEQMNIYSLSAFDDSRIELVIYGCGFPNMDFWKEKLGSRMSVLKNGLSSEEVV